MSDLVERLRDKTRLRKTHGLTGWVLHEEALTSNAADAIERLTAERDRLAKKLDEATEHGWWVPQTDYDALAADLAAANERIAREGRHANRVRILQLEADLAEARAVVAAQATDNGLWFEATTAPEAYLQQELRRLHAVIEGKA